MENMDPWKPTEECFKVHEKSDTWQILLISQHRLWAKHLAQYDGNHWQYISCYWVRGHPSFLICWRFWKHSLIPHSYSICAMYCSINKSWIFTVYPIKEAGYFLLKIISLSAGVCSYYVSNRRLSSLHTQKGRICK